MSVESRQEKIPRKLSINVDPGNPTAGNKTFTAVSTNNTPESASKAVAKVSHSKLKQE